MSFRVHGLQATEPYPVMKDDRSDEGKMARKSFGFPHEHQVDKGFVTKHRETQQLKMARNVVAMRRLRAESLQVKCLTQLDTSFYRF